MAKKKTRRIRRKMTSAERNRVTGARKQLDRERREIVRKGRSLKRQFDAAVAAVNSLKTARQEQGLSLSDLEARTGITRSALCKLESGKDINPTVKTLVRYATAVGKTLELSLGDNSE